MSSHRLFPFSVLSWRTTALAGLVIGLAGIGLARAGSAEEDVVTKVKSISSFTEVNLSALAGGEILTQRGPLLKFRRGISGESCYVVMKPSSATAKFIISSGPPKDDQQGVSFHADVQLPIRDEDFADLKLSTDHLSTRRLIAQTMAVTAGSANFAMSRAEAAEMEKFIQAAKGQSKTPAEITKTAWGNLLKGRAAQFQQAGLGQLAPYEMSGSPINPTSEMRSLLTEHSKVATEFAELLRETGVNESATQTKITPATNYCELLNWELKSTFDLGAVFLKDLGKGRYQLLDCQYYSSGIFYNSLCFFELWPIQIEGKEATLVWRADLLSAPTLEVTRGIERIAFGKIMMVEIKKSIQGFKKDLLAAP
jgi:hypothetical protein